MVGRRQFFVFGLAVGVWGAARRLLAQGAAALRYRPLARMVAVPVEDMATLWRGRQFIADGVTLDSAATPNQPLRIAGMVVRTEAGDATPQRFQAVCMRCPHEGCEVEYVRDPKNLPPELVAEAGRPITEPVYVCPCHNSTFAVDTGARIAGPAPRGLYRFRVTNVTSTAVEIGEVEEDVLLFTWN